MRQPKKDWVLQALLGVPGAPDDTPQRNPFSAVTSGPAGRGGWM